MTRRAAVAVVAMLAAGGCGGATSSSGPPPHTTVTVFAASSLTDAFTTAGRSFGRHGHNRDARFSFAGSQELVSHLTEGAPADVIATADTATMDEVRDELAGAPRTLAHNSLVIVTAAGNPRHVDSLADLADRGLVVVLAHPSVPAGNYAAQALDAAHVDVHAKSLELDVRSVLTKVEVGEADAGIVYATDARSAVDDVTTVPIDNAPEATYEIAPVTDAGRAFVDYMLSSRGQAILTRFGFLPP